jgi:L-aminopeptidase/D-esterase-like protein
MLKSGLGCASAMLPGGYTVGALVAVNALGDVYDPTTGQLVAGARNPRGTGWLANEPPDIPPSAGRTGAPVPGANTTLAVVATDAPLSKAEVAKLASMAHDGLARAIRPVHTPFDGDTVFALATGTLSPNSSTPVSLFGLSTLGALAADTLARAVVKAVRAASGLHGVPALTDLRNTAE